MQSGNPLYPDFPLEEFDRRYARARAMIRTAGLHALLVTEEHNYVYFTGHRSEQIRLDKVRPHVLLFPAEGDPVVFVMPFEARDVMLTSWLRDIRQCPLSGHISVIVEAIHERGLAGNRIGCELGPGQYLQLSYTDFTELTLRLPDASFVDAAKILLSLRAVKSPAEIDRCRRAAELAARAIDSAFNDVRPGVTHAEVAKLVRQRLLDVGAEGQTFLTVVSGLNFVNGLLSGLSTAPTQRTLESGDTLTVDTGALVAGYASDVCRVAVVGKASSRQRDFYRSMIDLHHACFEILKPGRTCDEVARLCAREVARFEHAFPTTSERAQTNAPGHSPETVGRIGHGVGRETTEYPSIRPGEEVLLEAGMIFTLNPSFLTEFGYYNSEE